LIGTQWTRKSSNPHPMNKSNPHKSGKKALLLKGMYNDLDQNLLPFAYHSSFP